MYQLAKTPLLFEHYVAHKAADKSLSVWGFFCEHYLNSSPNDPDYAADMQLPFKSHNECIAINLGCLRCLKQPSGDLTLLHINTGSEKKYPSYRPIGLTPVYLVNIWQPPKDANLI